MEHSDTKQKCVIVSDFCKLVIMCVIIKSFISDKIFQQSIGGVMVSIATFQAVDLGLIPGRCNFSPT